MRMIPAATKLNKRNARKTIGYRVLNVDGSPFSEFTREHVIEQRPAFYVATRGASVPDAGGFIVWGTKSRDLAEVEVGPAPRPAEPLEPIVRSIVAESAKETTMALSAIESRVASIDTASPTKESQAIILAALASSSEALGTLRRSVSELKTLEAHTVEVLTEKMGLADLLDEKLSLREMLSEQLAAVRLSESTRFGAIEKRLDALALVAEQPSADGEALVTIAKGVDGLRQALSDMQASGQHLSEVRSESIGAIEEFFNIIEVAEQG